jgi:hypothetical protein
MLNPDFNSRRYMLYISIGFLKKTGIWLPVARNPSLFPQFPPADFFRKRITVETTLSTAKRLYKVKSDNKGKVLKAIGTLTRENVADILLPSFRGFFP